MFLNGNIALQDWCKNYNSTIVMSYVCKRYSVIITNSFQALFKGFFFKLSTNIVTNFWWPDFRFCTSLFNQTTLDLRKEKWSFLIWDSPVLKSLGYGLKTLSKVYIEKNIRKINSFQIYRYVQCDHHETHYKPIFNF